MKKEPMPSAVDAAEEEGLEAATLEAVDETRSRTRMPVIEGAVVVYVGASKKKVVALNGRMYVAEMETGDKDEKGNPIMYIEKEAGDAGTQAYHFVTHDIRGRLIRTHIVPTTGSLTVGTPEAPYAVLNARQLPESLRGKPFETCEHPEHLRVFMRMRNAARELEFVVLVPPKQRAAFNEYVRLREARMGAEDAQIRETVA